MVLGIFIKDEDLKEVSELIRKAKNLDEQKLIKLINDFMDEHNYKNDDVEEEIF